MNDTLCTDQKMYLLMCSTGEYSDRCEYQLFVTSDEALAEDYVRRLEALLPPVQAAKSAWYRAPRRELNQPDPIWNAYRDACKKATDLFKTIVTIEDDKYFSYDDDFRAWVVVVPLMERS